MALPLVLQLFLLLTSSYPVTPSTAATVHIDADKGSNTNECVTGQSPLPCRTLHYAVTNSYNDTTFLLLSDLLLNTAITFTSRHNITIAGVDRQQRQLLCDPHHCSGTQCGLLFVNCKNLSLNNVGVKHCGILTTITSRKKVVKIRSGVIIRNGTGYTILYKFNASENNGYGAVIINTGTIVTISSSTFSNNKMSSQHKDAEIAGGGLYITTSCKYMGPTNAKAVSIYIISETLFYNNILRGKNNMFSVQTAAYGGGLSVDLGTNTTQMKLLTTNCQFINNTAHTGGGGMFIGVNSANSILTLSGNTFNKNQALFGGGFYINCRAHCINNTIKITSTTFKCNRVTLDSDESGGGGIYIVISESLQCLPFQNKLLFRNCSFANNFAMFGGGSNLYIYRKGVNEISFTNCSWTNNTSPKSPAVKIFPASLNGIGKQSNAFIIFSNCAFNSNFVNNYSYFNTTPSLNIKRQTGIFVTTQLHVHFSGNTHFVNNNGTALFATSSTIIFFRGSNVQFLNNTGWFGGAVFLLSFSLLQYQDDTIFWFIGNKASKGGAINVLSFEQYSCYLSYFEHGKEPNNVTFHFYDNKATTGVGSTMYITSVKGCLMTCSVLNKLHLEPSEIFVNESCLGKFVLNLPIIPLICM